MSMILAGQVWDIPLESAAEKLVLLKLADNAHDDGSSARPGILYLMQKTNRSEATVRRALRGLEDAGLIEAVAHAKGGRGMVTEYQLHLEKGLSVSPLPILPTPPKGAHGESKGAHGESRPVSRKEVVLLNHQEPKAPSGTSPSAPAPPHELVSFYVDECRMCGYSPIATWRNALGNQIKRVSKEKPPDIIRSAIRIMADERKAPGVLAHVIADIEYGRNGNGKQA